MMKRKGAICIDEAIWLAAKSQAIQESRNFSDLVETALLKLVGAGAVQKAAQAIANRTSGSAAVLSRRGPLPGLKNRSAAQKAAKPNPARSVHVTYPLQNRAETFRAAAVADNGRTCGLCGRQGLTRSQGLAAFLFHYAGCGRPCVGGSMGNLTAEDTVGGVHKGRDCPACPEAVRQTRTVYPPGVTP